ncbi:MAG TPA: hypothetical protein VMH80_14355 [Bryobacteraceae bacterium]|nr:hypothetical protein [Bryobacteraceae bacterium]
MIYQRSARIAFAVVLAAALPARGQTSRPGTLDGKPNLNGIWQSVGTADWDLEDHSAKAGPFWQYGAIGAIPPGKGVVEGGQIPYLPAALTTKMENASKWPQEDPEAKCYMPGVPRAAYLPYPFQIVQSASDILFVYEYATTNRLINMGKFQEAGADSWMGTSNGHWEGNTLVIDVTGLNGKAWLDRAGDYATSNLHVVERYTLLDADHMTYEATLEDPKVFTRPWKISMPLYRRIEKDAQLLDFKCVPFSEELLYGKYKKHTGD